MASGFSINEQGAKALGMGGAFAAQANDPSAVYYNPAGITQLEGTQIQVGVSAISPSVGYTSGGTSYFGGEGDSNETEDKTFYIPTFYITHKINDMVSVGFGSFTNFGLGTDWKNDWEGAYLIGGTNAQIETYNFNPVVAVQASDKFSFAFGLVYQELKVTLESKLPPVVHPELGPLFDESDLKFETDNGAWSWNVGALYKFNDNWSLGFSYRPSVHHATSGDASTNSAYDAFAAAFNAGVTADITLPAVTYIGTAWTNGRLTIELDGQFTEWSSYNELEPEGVPVEAKDKDWNDVWAVRLGGEYKLNKFLDLRAGIIRDYSPVPDETVDPMLPSGDRWLYSIGAGFHFGKFDLDLSYIYLQVETRTFDNHAGELQYPAGVNSNITGEFKDNYAHIFAASLTYKF
jgi:long-chain fatty acid transport protein